MIEDLEHGMHSACLRVFGSVNQPADPRMSDSAGAHRAGLNRHVDFAVEQTVVADGRSGFTQREDLSVCRGIVGRKRTVASPAYDSALAHDDCSDGDLALREA